MITTKTALRFYDGRARRRFLRLVRALAKEGLVPQENNEDTLMALHCILLLTGEEMSPRTIPGQYMVQMLRARLRFIARNQK